MSVQLAAFTQFTVVQIAHKAPGNGEMKSGEKFKLLYKLTFENVRSAGAIANVSLTTLEATLPGD